VTDATGKRLKKIRCDAGLTWQLFALRLGLSGPNYLRYEFGNREISSHLLLKLFQEFGADSIWLLTGSPRIVKSDRSYRNHDG